MPRAPRKKQGGKNDIRNDIMPGPDLAYAALDKKTAQTSEAHVIVNGKRRLMRIHEIPQENNTTLGLAEDVTEARELEKRPQTLSGHHA
ncbi:MAG: hypothetical protein LRZ85_10315 [Alphaproteobacteria bacterium]|nr:hypothetical protein [Alphaproteobacteria bacterium]